MLVTLTERISNLESPATFLGVDDNIIPFGKTPQLALLTEDVLRESSASLFVLLNID